MRDDEQMEPLGYEAAADRVARAAGRPAPWWVRVVVRLVALTAILLVGVYLARHDGPWSGAGQWMVLVAAAIALGTVARLLAGTFGRR